LLITAQKKVDELASAVSRGEAKKDELEQLHKFVADLEDQSSSKSLSNLMTKLRQSYLYCAGF
jgi:hypothetical protein